MKYYMLTTPKHDSFAIKNKWEKNTKKNHLHFASFIVSVESKIIISSLMTDSSFFFPFMITFWFWIYREKEKILCVVPITIRYVCMSVCMCVCCVYKKNFKPSSNLICMQILFYMYYVLSSRIALFFSFGFMRLF